MQADQESQQAILRVADMIGGLMEFWGFKRNMGRMWCVLFLESEPLSAQDLCQRLSLSTGAVSMTLGELQKWGVVRKAWVPGQRRDYFEPETDIWKMVSRVFRERELREIQASIETFAGALKTIAEREAAASGPEREKLEFIRTRMTELRELARIAEKLLDAMLQGESIDASPLALFKLEDED
jgi:DNA-binding transcriptional regulator GbsR (MarR family)